MDSRNTRQGNRSERRPAIVLGGQVNGLGVIRSLGRLGVPVALVAVEIDGDHAHQSRYVRHVKHLAVPFEDEEIHVALEEARRVLPGNFPVLIPTADRFSQFLSRNQSDLASLYTLNCADREINESFLDKWRTAEICAQYGVQVPRTECPGTREELEQVAESIDYPVIVKPRYTFDTLFPGKNATIQTASDLLELYETNDIIEKAVVQEVIPSGDGDILVISSYSDKDGIVQAMYSGRKIRQHLPDYGATCLGISESYPDLRERTRIFLESVSYRGFAMTEFARSRDDKQEYFLELNTRTSWTNQLYADAGVDLTQVAYWDMTGSMGAAGKSSPVQKDNVVWLDFRRDMASMRLKREAGQITLSDWFRSIVRANSFAHWDWRDPIPFFVACGWRIRKSVAHLVVLFFGKSQEEF